MDIFEKEMQRPTLFLDRNVLSPHFIPEILPHREKQIEQIMKTIAPTLKGQRSNNLLIYGKTGTGKSASTKHVLEKLLEVKKKYNANVEAIYVNCRILNTKYQVMLKCAEYCSPNETFIGYPFSHVFGRVVEYVKEKALNFVVVLDEIDKVKDLDDLIYTLTRSNDELPKGHITTIGITNDATFKDKLDPRSKSTLCEEEMVFAPYNAEQLCTILDQRIKIGFKEDTIKSSALNLASALAAQESGDARYALKLILKAGEIADELKRKKVSDELVRMARKGVEDEIIYEIISTLPEHQKIVLYGITQLTTETTHYSKLDGTLNEKVLFSGEVYERYSKLARNLGKSPRSARWCREYVNDLEMLGLLTTSISGKGVRGNTTLIKLALPPAKIIDTIEKYFKQ